MFIKIYMGCMQKVFEYRSWMDDEGIGRILREIVTNCVWIYSFMRLLIDWL